MRREYVNNENGKVFIERTWEGEIGKVRICDVAEYLAKVYRNTGKLVSLFEGNSYSTYRFEKYSITLWHMEKDLERSMKMPHRKCYRVYEIA